MKFEKTFVLKGKIKTNILIYLKNKKKNKILSLFSKKIIKALESNGSVVIKGFLVDKKHQKNINNYKEFMRLFGKILSQNKKKEKIVEIKDLGKKWSAHTRGYKTNDFLDLHTDGGSLASLFCIKDAPYGGESTCVNARTIYDMINDKVLKRKLFEGFKYHRRGEATDSLKITKRKYPIFFYKKNILHCTYNRKPIEEALKFQKKFSEINYLNKFDNFIFKKKKNISQFKLQPGDIWIVNNYKVLHGRKKFINNKAKQKRLLLRAWIKPAKFKFSGKTYLEALNNI